MQKTTFNTGFMCKNCGPVKESTKRTIAKVQRDCCKVCSDPVTKWTRPLKERAGRCRNCANASFTMKVGKGKVRGQLIRKCKRCGQVDSVESGEVLEPGEEG